MGRAWKKVRPAFKSVIVKPTDMKPLGRPRRRWEYIPLGPKYSPQDPVYFAILHLEIILKQLLRPLGRPRRRWEYTIRMDLEEIGINAGNWVDSAHDRNYCRARVNAALNLRVS